MCLSADVGALLYLEASEVWFVCLSEKALYNYTLNLHNVFKIYSLSREDATIVGKMLIPLCSSDIVKRFEVGVREVLDTLTIGPLTDEKCSKMGISMILEGNRLQKENFLKSVKNNDENKH